MKIALAAHRCGTDKYPELTLDAARYSISIGADCVEMDIRFTKDKVPVISHDKDASRLFGMNELVEEMNLEKFSSLSYKNHPGYRSVTLNEVLSSGVGPILFHVKTGGVKINDIMECIRKYNYEDKVIMGVTAAEDVETVKKIDSKIRALAFMPEKSQMRNFIDAGADIIRLWEDWISAMDVETIKNAGSQIWVMAGRPFEGSVGYTEDENIIKWKQYGVDGIIINEIEKAKKLLDADS